MRESFDSGSTGFSLVEAQSLSLISPSVVACSTSRCTATRMSVVRDTPVCLASAFNASSVRWSRRVEEGTLDLFFKAI
jgi:hypothetical protein